MAETGNASGDGEKAEVEELEAPEAEDVSEEPSDDGPEEPEVPVEVDPLTQARQEAEDCRDRWMRLAAEFDNYKKRTAREFQALVQTASEDVIRGLLPVLDAVDRALAHGGEGEGDSGEFREGTRMIMEQLPKVLQDRGLSEIKAVGESFDPHFHEALMQVESEAHEAGAVAEVVEKGYMLGDKVIRHSRVVVSGGPPPPDTVKKPGKKAKPKKRAR